jgi:phosphotransferase system enzyme I (PtsI)
MTLPREENPFLGKRALRLCFDETNLFLTQLRAALRASAFGKLQIMFPMVGSIDDIRRAKAFVEQAKSELCARGEAFDEGLRLGIMIEIPSIAAAADLAAREVDFASIGTNDLCQYLFAADRMNPELTEYCQPFAPALLRVLRQIIFAFNAADKEISLCGEMAGDPRATALLAGMGLRKFSMSASSIGQVKMTISQTDVKAAQKLAEEAITFATQAEIMELLHRRGIGK